MFMSKVFFTYMTVVGLYSSAYAAVQRSPGQSGRGSLRCDKEEDEIQKPVIAHSVHMEGNHLNINGTMLQQNNSMVSIAPHLRSSKEEQDTEVLQSTLSSNKTGAGLKGATMTSVIQAQPKDQEQVQTDGANTSSDANKEDPKPDADAPKPEAPKTDKPAEGDEKCAAGKYWSKKENDCVKGCDANSKSLTPNENDNCECKEDHMCYEKHLEEEIKILIKELSKDAQTKIEDIVKAETANSPPTPSCPMNEDGSTKSNPHTASSKVFYQAGCAHCHCVKNSAPRTMVISTLLLMAGTLLGSGLL